MRRRHSAPTSVVVLHPQLVEVHAVVGLFDGGVRNMLEAIADLEALAVEAITKTHVRTELILSAEVAVSDRGARQEMGADAGFRVRTRESVRLKAKHGRNVEIEH